MGTEYYDEQPLPTRHDSYQPESSKGGMHYEIGVLDDYDEDKENSCKKEKTIRPNEKETLDYLEEDRESKTELGNLEKVNKIKDER